MRGVRSSWRARPGSARPRCWRRRAPRARGRAEAAGGARDGARAGVRVRRRAAAARARGPRRRRGFEGAARYAAALLDVALAEPAPLPFGPEGAFAVLHGLYRLTANLARRRPLALLVDDAHWADAASLRFLAYLGNRLEPGAGAARGRRAAARRAGRRRGRRAAGEAALPRCCARRRSATARRRSSCAPPSRRP